MSGPWKGLFVLGIGLFALVAHPAEPALVPVTVCEVLRDLPAYEGKPVAVLGRYSYRQDGRWLGEQACDAGAPPLLWLTEDTQNGPKPPNNFELDGPALNQKFADMRKHTSLGKFRFGNPDYDRWAVVYGRVEERKGESTKKALADLAFRGDGVVVFLNP
jgi:hypothetical protein